MTRMVDGLVQVAEPIVHMMLYVLRVLVKILSIIHDVLRGLKLALMEIFRIH